MENVFCKKIFLKSILKIKNEILIFILGIYYFENSILPITAMYGIQKNTGRMTMTNLTAIVSLPCQSHDFPMRDMSEMSWVIQFTKLVFIRLSVRCVAAVQSVFVIPAVYSNAA